MGFWILWIVPKKYNKLIPLNSFYTLCDLLENFKLLISTPISFKLILSSYSASLHSTKPDTFKSYNVKTKKRPLCFPVSSTRDLAKPMHIDGLDTFLTKDTHFTICKLHNNNTFLYINLDLIIL